jgi:hypothetical protein
MWADNVERICVDSMKDYLRINVSTLKQLLKKKKNSYAYLLIVSFIDD